jgi:predicted O-methyltransferase YrrM
VFFLVRLLRPVVAVETGVAAGWTTEAVLEAMDRNGIGHLWSSDFPLFRLPGSDDVVGLLVSEHHRARWTLRVDGDRKNLRHILSECGPVELVHYDSDKSQRGRRRAMSMLTPKLAADAVVVMDDIDDNAFFRDAAAGRDDVEVFSLAHKFVGLLGAADGRSRS